MIIIIISERKTRSSSSLIIQFFYHHHFSTKFKYIHNITSLTLWITIIDGKRRSKDQKKKMNLSIISKLIITSSIASRMSGKFFFPILIITNFHSSYHVSFYYIWRMSNGWKKKKLIDDIYKRFFDSINSD